MNKPTTITAHPHADTAAMVERVAEGQCRPVTDYAKEPIRRAAERDAGFLVSVQEGVDAVDAGDCVSHDVAMAMLDEMVAFHEARCVR